MKNTADIETPKQLLNRKIEEFRNLKDLLNAIADSAVLTQDGQYCIPAGLIEAAKRMVA